MLVDVVLFPAQLKPSDVSGRLVVVFDVLRATTSMTAALVAGIDRIVLFPNSDTARAARRDNLYGDALLCGEERCKPPVDFHLGNSPGAFSAAAHARRTLLMATTNGTGAILAACGATHRFIGALVNASAVARKINGAATDVTLLCAGTGGDVAAEDLLGAGAVIDALSRLNPSINLASDRAWVARSLFASSKNNLLESLRATRGGRNVIEAGLEPDIAFAARLDAFDVVGEVVQPRDDSPPFVSRAGASR